MGARARLAWLCGLAALAGACTRAPELFAPGPARNLVLVSIDTLRADHLGAYGYARPTSPTLDRLAGEGTLFRHAVAAAPWTLPAHASLLTGLYPSRHGARGLRDALDPHVPVLAELLREHGFRTWAVVSAAVLGARSGLARGFDRFEYAPEWMRGPGAMRLPRDPGADVTQRALGWLAGAGDAPFFLFLHYYDPHSDYAARPEYRERFVGPYRGPIDGSTRQLLQVLQGRRQLTDDDVRHLRDLYDAEIRQVDDELGALVELLDSSGLSRTTALVVTADHGEEFMERGAVLHARTYYDEVIAVPLVARGAGVPRGLRVVAPVSQVDVAPTLLALAGLEAPASMEGEDLTRFWRGPPPPGDRLVFAEADHSNAWPDQMRMVRGARYKLIFDRRSQKSRLFDLSEDPGETTDLAAQRPEVVRERLAALRAFEAGGHAEAGAAELSPEDLDALRDLGYVEGEARGAPPAGEAAEGAQP